MQREVRAMRGRCRPTRGVLQYRCRLVAFLPSWLDDILCDRDLCRAKRRRLVTLSQSSIFSSEASSRDLERLLSIFDRYIFDIELDNVCRSGAFIEVRF